MVPVLKFAQHYFTNRWSKQKAGELIKLAYSIGWLVGWFGFKVVIITNLGQRQK